MHPTTTALCAYTRPIPNWVTAAQANNFFYTTTITSSSNSTTINNNTTTINNNNRYRRPLVRWTTATVGTSSSLRRRCWRNNWCRPRPKRCRRSRPSSSADRTNNHPRRPLRTRPLWWRRRLRRPKTVSAWPQLRLWLRLRPRPRRQDAWLPRIGCRDVIGGPSEWKNRRPTTHADTRDAARRTPRVRTWRRTCGRTPARNHTSVTGADAAGSSRGPTSWRDTSASTPATARSSAGCAIGRSHGPIICRCTWNGTTCNNATTSKLQLIILLYYYTHHVYELFFHDFLFFSKYCYY